MTEKQAGELVLLIASGHPSYAATKEAAVAAAKLWHEVLGEIPYEEAREHLIAHFRESEYLPKPVDIIRRARDKRESRVDELVKLDSMEYATRIGQAADYEGRIDILVEYYGDLFANQLEMQDKDKIGPDEVKEALMAMLDEVPGRYSEQSIRIASVVYVLGRTRRFLTPAELVEKALERTAERLERADHG